MMSLIPWVGSDTGATAELRYGRGAQSEGDEVDARETCRSNNWE